jgi:hypothetical protein
MALLANAQILMSKSPVIEMFLYETDISRVAYGFLALFGCMPIIGFILILRAKKAGFLLNCAAALIIFIANIVILGFSWAVALGLLSPIITWLVIRKSWHLFDAPAGNFANIVNADRFNNSNINNDNNDNQDFTALPVVMKEYSVNNSKFDYKVEYHFTTNIAKETMRNAFHKSINVNADSITEDSDERIEYTCGNQKLTFFIVEICFTNIGAILRFLTYSPTATNAENVRNAAKNLVENAVNGIKSADENVKIYLLPNKNLH